MSVSIPASLYGPLMVISLSARPSDHRRMSLVTAEAFSSLIRTSISLDLLEYGLCTIVVCVAHSCLQSFVAVYRRRRLPRAVAGPIDWCSSQRTDVIIFLLYTSTFPLTPISLDCNFIGSKGAGYLSAALTQNRSLRSLRFATLHWVLSD